MYLKIALIMVLLTVKFSLLVLHETELRGRKRKRNPINWKSNKSKRCKNEGKDYTDKNGKFRQAKKNGAWLWPKMPL